MIGYCLPSQDIREKIKEGKLVTAPFSDAVEDRIQTNSFDPVLGDVCYWIDEAIASHIRADTEVPISEILETIDSTYVKKFDCTSGFELHVGHTYLVPLKESFILEEDEYVKFSPKSSSGRVFLDVRAIADYHNCIDIIHPRFCGKKQTGAWLVIKPLIFNVVIYPDISLNQARFFKGIGARLNRNELEETHKKKTIVCVYDEEKKDVVPLEKPFFTEDGLILSLGLQSRNFERILDDLEVMPGDNFILFSNEWLQVPVELSAEMKAYSLTSIRGPLHFAGFFDNRFTGDAVIELHSDEQSPTLLHHASPMIEFEFYRTRDVPDKLYGDEKSGSHYYAQRGPKVAKYFKKIDLSDAIALRAKKTPIAIDLRKKGEYDVHDFFEIY